MKTKRFSKKLALTKKTVTRLNSLDQEQAKGGVEETVGCITSSPTCNGGSIFYCYGVCAPYALVKPGTP